MHDDTDAGRLIPVNPPALAIDYLGNGWSNEDDIAESWKFMTKQKNDLVNGLRLENASWRNWAKQRHNLKTISPKSLNWLKDSDTTWLYGPLYKAAIDEFDKFRFGAQTVSPNVSGSVSIPTTPTQETLDPVDIASPSAPPCSTSAPTTPPKSITGESIALKSGRPLKPVLKHKTASELFKADTLFHVQSDSRLNRKIMPLNKARESAVFKQHRQPKLRFNDFVEQYISIDSDVISEEDEESLASDTNNDNRNSRTSSNNNYNSDRSDHNIEDTKTGIDRHLLDKKSELITRNSSRSRSRSRSRPPPRSIARIDSTTLKAANHHGMHYEGFEDQDDITTTEEEDEEGLFDEPIYLGNPYTGSGTAYIGSRLDDPYEAVLDDVSYTRPSPPSQSAGSIVSSIESSASSPNAVAHSVSPIPKSINEQLQNQELQQQQQQNHQQQYQHQQTATYVVTQTSPRTTSPLMGQSSSSITTTTTPIKSVPSAARTALTSALEAEKAMAANGGMQQRATDLVANVKGLVNWASSFVFNSSTF
ncbi:hypothetical protein FBU30_010782 [Linnemannia zychae]|nr:hypothetical protein FBU30_010782 [Linnemannia zychae]